MIEKEGPNILRYPLSGEKAERLRKQREDLARRRVACARELAAKPPETTTQGDQAAQLSPSHLETAELEGVLNGYIAQPSRYDKKYMCLVAVEYLQRFDTQSADLPEQADKNSDTETKEILALEDHWDSPGLVYEAAAVALAKLEKYMSPKHRPELGIDRDRVQVQEDRFSRIFRHAKEKVVADMIRETVNEVDELVKATDFQEALKNREKIEKCLGLLRAYIL